MAAAFAPCIEPSPWGAAWCPWRGAGQGVSKAPSLAVHGLLPQGKQHLQAAHWLLGRGRAAHGTAREGALQNEAPAPLQGCYWGTVQLGRGGVSCCTSTLASVARGAERGHSRPSSARAPPWQPVSPVQGSGGDVASQAEPGRSCSWGRGAERRRNNSRLTELLALVPGVTCASGPGATPSWPPASLGKEAEKEGPVERRQASRARAEARLGTAPPASVRGGAAEGWPPPGAGAPGAQPRQRLLARGGLPRAASPRWGSPGLRGLR